MAATHELPGADALCPRSSARSGAPPGELQQHLQAALSRRAWAAAAPPAPALASVVPAAAAVAAADEPATPGTSAFSAAHAGVAGILRRQEAAQRELGASVDEAFTDLEALMDKAREMMAFAERMRATMQRDLGEAAEELEARRRGVRRGVRRGAAYARPRACGQAYMLTMGIASPVTRQTAGALFHQQLALQARRRVLARA